MQSPRWRCETTRADDNAEATPYRLGLDADGFYNIVAVYSTTEEVVFSSQSSICHTANDAVNAFSALCAINHALRNTLFTVRSFLRWITFATPKAYQLAGLATMMLFHQVADYLLDRSVNILYLKWRCISILLATRFQYPRISSVSTFLQWWKIVVALNLLHLRVTTHSVLFQNVIHLF